VLLDFIEKGIEFPHVNLVAREDYLETQAQTVKAFMKATWKQFGITKLTERKL
jgi:hypothetical protein